MMMILQKNKVESKVGDEEEEEEVRSFNRTDLDDNYD
jgi:hypothetical protein